MSIRANRLSISSNKPFTWWYLTKNCELRWANDYFFVRQCLSLRKTCFLVWWPGPRRSCPGKSIDLKQYWWRWWGQSRIWMWMSDSQLFAFAAGYSIWQPWHHLAFETRHNNFLDLMRFWFILRCPKMPNESSKEKIPTPVGTIFFSAASVEEMSSHEAVIVKWKHYHLSHRAAHKLSESKLVSAIKHFQAFLRHGTQALFYGFWNTTTMFFWTSLWVDNADACDRDDLHLNGVAPWYQMIKSKPFPKRPFVVAPKLCFISSKETQCFF